MPKLSSHRHVRDIVLVEISFLYAPARFTISIEDSIDTHRAAESSIGCAIKTNRKFIGIGRRASTAASKIAKESKGRGFRTEVHAQMLLAGEWSH